MEKAYTTENGVEVIDKKTADAQKKLESITLRINEENLIARTSLFNIAGALSEAKAICKDAGYKGIGDYSDKVFGYSKSATSKMVAVAEKFLLLNEVKDESTGKVSRFYTCDLPNTDGSQWTLGQLEEMLEYSKAEVCLMISNNILTSNMRAIDIRKAIADVKKQLADKQAEKDNADKQESGENKQESGENKQESGENKQESGENKQESGENKQESAENKQDIPFENVGSLSNEQRNTLSAVALNVKSVYEEIKSVRKYAPLCELLEKSYKDLSDMLM